MRQSVKRPSSAGRTTRLAAAILCLASLAATAGPGRAATPATKPAPPAAPRHVKAYVAVFDFACEQGDYGKQIADSVRLRLARHEDYDVTDGLTMQAASEPLPAGSPRDDVVKIMDRLATNLAVYGTVQKTGNTVAATIECLDLTDPKSPILQKKLFHDASEQSRGEIARQIVQTITGAEEWVPPQYGDEAEPDNFGQPVNLNGDFEKGSAHWDRPDNVSAFIEKGPAGRGMILRVQTDLARDPWLAYTRALRLGQADPAKPPVIKRDTSEGSVAGLEGVHYRSEWIKATPLQRYWLTADHKGKGGAKIFVKGYRDMSAYADGLSEVSLVERKLSPADFAKLSPPQRTAMIADDVKLHPDRYRRECYRWYLNCGAARGEWKHAAAPVPPRGGLPDYVEWLQIQIYSYWPPGEYLWDNVFLYKDPNQKAPLKEESARTPNFGKAGAPTSKPAAASKPAE